MPLFLWLFYLLGERMFGLSEKKIDLLICIALIIVIALIYWQVQEFKFVYYDDNEYVTEKAHVMAGVTWPGIKWALGATEAGFWHPLTWLSLMLDRELFNNNPGGFHWTNVIFHISNTLLIYFVLRAATAAPLRSAFVALLFAIHPLHVESVAWVSQRKDLLSTFFGFLCLLAYVKYAELPSWRKYLLVLVFFVLSLMSKPMIVTFPVVMLLMDYWPLMRMGSPGAGVCRELENQSRSAVKLPFKTLLLEKLPFFLLSAASSILVIFTERKVGALTRLENLGVAERFANAIVSYAKYIMMMFWPVDLAFIYPHPVTQPVLQVIGAAVIILAMTILIMLYFHYKPYLLFGWCWYLVVLLPVIGFIQVGPHALADRYTYVSLIGLFVILVWGVTDLSRKWRYRSIILSIVGLVTVVGFSISAWIQVGYWKNSVTLFEHAIKVTKNNYIALNNLGCAYTGNGEIDKGIYYLGEAIKIKPKYATLYNNMGIILFSQGKYEESISNLIKAQKMSFRSDVNFRYLGDAYLATGKDNLALEAYRNSLILNKNNDMAKIGIETILNKRNQTE